MDGYLPDKYCQKKVYYDEDAIPSCQLCSNAFGILVRRYHCKACGLCVCAECSKLWSENSL